MSDADSISSNEPRFRKHCPPAILNSPHVSAYLQKSHAEGRRHLTLPDSTPALRYLLIAQFGLPHITARTKIPWQTRNNGPSGQPPAVPGRAKQGNWRKKKSDDVPVRSIQPTQPRSARCQVDQPACAKPLTPPETPWAAFRQIARAVGLHQQRLVGWLTEFSRQGNHVHVEILLSAPAAKADPEISPFFAHVYSQPAGSYQVGLCRPLCFTTGSWKSP